MSTIITRAGKGSPLTHNEVDANFTNLNDDKVQVTGTPSNGQAILWNSTSNAWVPGAVDALPSQSGNNGKFLTTNGSAASWATVPAGPTGPTGPQGPQGDAATVDVGTVTTVDPTDPATVTNSGTTSAAIFDFEIPKGEKGDKGDTGDTGPAGANATPLTAIGYVIDGDGDAITTGTLKPGLRVPFAGTIESVTLMADASGSIVIDIWKDTYANYPPTVLDSICASAKPTLSSAIKSEDTTLTGWTKTISAGDILLFNVDSASTVKQVTVILKVTKT